MRRTTRDWLLAFALFVVALWTYSSFVPTTPFHRDEARWTHRARFAEELLHPLSAYWQDRDLTQGQPPLGSYVTGLGLLAQGRGVETNELWSFYFSEAWNLRHNRMPAPEDHTAARQTNSVIGALIVVGVFFIGLQLTNWVGGLVGALLMIPHPLAIYLSSLAGSDALLSLLVVWSVLAGIALAKRPTWARAVLLGAMLGLGASTKLSPLAVAIPLAGLGGVLVIAAYWLRGAEAKRVLALGARLLAVPAITFAVFVLSYPYLWPNPLRRTLTLFNYRNQEMASQSRIWSNLGIPDTAAVFGRFGYWLGDRDATSTQIAQTVAGWFGHTWHPGGIDLLFALIGALVLTALVIKHGFASPQALAAGILAAELAIVVVGLQADFQRYYLPILVTVAVCTGVLAGQLWAVVSRRWAERHAANLATAADEPVGPTLQPPPLQA